MSDKLQKIGALWRKTSERTGSQYYTGDIDIPGGGTIKVIAFDNDRKDKETQPDIQIYLNEKAPRSDAPPRRNYQPPAAPAAPKSTERVVPEDRIEYPQEDINIDEIPF